VLKERATFNVHQELKCKVQGVVACDVYVCVEAVEEHRLRPIECTAVCEVVSQPSQV